MIPSFAVNLGGPGENWIEFEGRRSGLPPSAADLVYALSEHYPSGMRRELLEQALWGAGARPKTARSNVYVFLGQARVALRPLGWTIDWSQRDGHRLFRLPLGEA